MSSVENRCEETYGILCGEFARLLVEFINGPPDDAVTRGRSLLGKIQTLGSILKRQGEQPKEFTVEMLKLAETSFLEKRKAREETRKEYAARQRNLARSEKS